jgi:UDP-N-acetylglucosamine--N-acetylmuramyl-(pentapeptide) pyrophosphoryl-undecaprenol N-acetylglucosamine transferase
LNGKPVVDIGGALMVPDAELSTAKVVELVVPLLTDRRRLSAMSAAAQGSGHRVADEVLAKMVLEAVRK